MILFLRVGEAKRVPTKDMQIPPLSFDPVFKDDVQYDETNE